MTFASLEGKTALVTGASKGSKNRDVDDLEGLSLLHQFTPGEF
jgi:hypothetical protein